MDVLTITHHIHPSQSAITAASIVRVVAMSIAVYDYLLTLPLEYRIYKGSKGFSPGLILFVLIRYSSVVMIVISNVGFYYPHFTPQSCAHYFYLIPVIREIQVMVSQAILGFLTYVISRHNRWVARIVSVAYFVTVGYQWVSVLVYRYPATISNSDQGDCLIGNSRPDSPISTWSMYVAAMLYDCLVLSIATRHLNMSTVWPGKRILIASKLVKIFIYDGLAYVVALTAVNVVNIILYRRASGTIQTAGSPVGYVATWIMTQRFLIHPRMVREEDDCIVMTPPTLRAVPPVAPFSVKKKVVHEVDQACTADFEDKSVDKQTDMHIEQSVSVDVHPV